MCRSFLLRRFLTRDRLVDVCARPDAESQTHSVISNQYQRQIGGGYPVSWINHFYQSGFRTPKFSQRKTKSSDKGVYNKNLAILDNSCRVKPGPRRKQQIWAKTFESQMDLAQHVRVLDGLAMGNLTASQFDCAVYSILLDSELHITISYRYKHKQHLAYICDSMFCTPL